MTDQTTAPPTPQEVPGGNLVPVYTNFFSITSNSLMVRISFGEGFGDPATARFHVAVTMLAGDAKALLESLQQTLSAIQALTTASAQTTTTAAPGSSNV